MGTNTLAKITSDPDYTTLIEVMKTLPKFSNIEIVSLEEPSMKTYIDNDGKEVEWYDTGSARINFEYRFSDTNEPERRSMFCIAHSKDKTFNSSITPYMPEKHMYCSLGTNGHSVDIMRDICSVLGGIVIKNDCADENDEDFFEIINSDNHFVIDNDLKELFDAISDMGTIQKYDFVKAIEANKDVINKYLNKDVKKKKKSKFKSMS
jgi:hypothetical protein